MKYLIQVRFNGADAVVSRLPVDEQEKLTAEFQALRRLPGVLDGNQLAAPSAATTVRVSGGETLAGEGPAVDARDALSGYYIYDSPDLDTAIAFAARVPVARMGATVEVRAMMER